MSRKGRSFDVMGEKWCIFGFGVVAGILAAGWMAPDFNLHEDIDSLTQETYRIQGLAERASEALEDLTRKLDDVQIEIESSQSGRALLAAVERRKHTALARSMEQLRRDLEEGYYQSRTEVWEAHRERAQAAQNSYEAEIAVITEKAIGHFEYPAAKELMAGDAGGER